MTTTTATIDPKKPIKTTSGLSARIVCTDLKHTSYSIAAAIMIDASYETVETFTAEGKYFDDGEDNYLDLVNVPEFDARKPFKTSDGHSAYLLSAIIENPEFPLAAVVMLNDGREVVLGYTAEGKYLDTASSHRYDLVNI